MGSAAPPRRALRFQARAFALQREPTTLFIVYHDASVRRSTERLVWSLRFAVETFASAKEFLARARVEGPACLGAVQMARQLGLSPEGGAGPVPRDS